MHAQRKDKQNKLAKIFKVILYKVRIQLFWIACRLSYRALCFYTIPSIFLHGWCTISYECSITVSKIFFQPTDTQSPIFDACAPPTNSVASFLSAIWLRATVRHFPISFVQRCTNVKKNRFVLERMKCGAWLKHTKSLLENVDTTYKMTKEERSTRENSFSLFSSTSRSISRPSPNSAFVTPQSDPFPPLLSISPLLMSSRDTN